MPRLIYDKAALDADASLGKYTVRELAHKYKVSSTTAHRAVQKASKNLGTLVNRMVEIKQELAPLTEQERNTFEREVNERTKHLALINNATHTNINRMMRKFNPKDAEFIPNMDVMEHKAVQSTIKDARESLLGKELPPTPTPEEQRAIDIGRDDIKKTLKVIQGKFNSLGVDVT